MSIERTTSVNPDFESFVAEANAFLAHSEEVMRQMNEDMEQLGDIATDDTVPGSASQYAADALLRYGVDMLFQSNLLLNGM